MKYLFFDVECSNCHNGIGKLCEFGYVLTDEKFNILAKDDIPMSPGKGNWSRFDLTGRKGERDLVLAYDYDYYYAQPEFPSFYARIKKLMCDKDTICFAYSMGNDLRHVHKTCERYKLEPLNYECYDVQMMVAKYLEQKGQMNLETACKTIVGPSSLIGLEEHLSRDDAKMEMMVFEAICVLEQKDSKTLLEESSFARTNSIEFVNRIRERSQKKQIIQANHHHYFSLVALDEVLDDSQNKGKRYNVSDKLKKDKDKMSIIVEAVKNAGGLLSGRIRQTDFLIVFDDKNREEVINSLRHPFDGEILTYQEFIDSINKQ